jgi:hypothetical protein
MSAKQKLILELQLIQLELSTLLIEETQSRTRKINAQKDSIEMINARLESLIAQRSDSVH